MNVINATATSPEPGPLTRVAMEYAQALESLVTTPRKITIEDWEPLKAYIAADEFKRVGAYLEVLNWDEYVQFLTAWAGGTKFETTVFAFTEVGRTVFQEIEERHYRGDEFVRKNVVAVYRFNENNMIVHLDIYEQARDTGQWIAQAAKSVETADISS